MTVIDDTTDRADRPLVEATVIGQRLLRKEDPALLTGEGVFTNDMKVPGALHLAVVRSPYAHARIVSIDTSAAAAMPGVRAVYTGADLESTWAAPMPCAWPVTDDMKNPTHYPLAVHTAHYSGDGVAVVLAESDAIARDAIEAIDVQYEPLEAVTDLEDASSDRVIVHEELGTNTSYTWNLLIEEQEGDVQRAFDAATYTVQRAVRAAAAAADGDGAARRGGDAAAVRRRHDAVLVHPGAAHPEGDDGDHARHPRAPDARRRPGRRRWVRRQAQRLRRGTAVRGAGPQARHARALERGALRERRGHHPRPWPDPAHGARRRRRTAS